MTARSRGTALMCDASGRIVAVIRDDLGIVRDPASSPRFADLLDEGSRAKAAALLDHVRTDTTAFDWELAVIVAGRSQIVHFAGSSEGEQILLIANTSRVGLEDCCQEMMQLANEQASHLRTALENLDAARRSEPDRTVGLYDDLMRLNNELADLQRELAKKNAELARLNDLKNQFLGMAAHDLRSPLSVISTYLGFLREDLAGTLNEEQREFISTISRSSDFVLRLIEDLLDVAAIESGRLDLDFERVELGPIVEHNIAMSRMLAERKGISLTLAIADAMPRVNADPRRIEQVLTNLISNAIKYSKSETTISVTVSAEAGEVSISVSDQGQGIPVDELERLFRPFGKTSVRGTAGEKSTGLGLLIVRKIVEGHHGRVTVESRVGEGSEFRVTLPAA